MMESLAANSWACTDNYHPEFRRDGSETVPVVSESHLREVLTSFSSQDPRVLLLKNIKGLLVSVAIGGPFAGVDYYADLQTGVPASAKAITPYTDRAMWFVSEGQPVSVEPANLIPTEKMIELVTYICQALRLPDWFDRV